MSKQYTIDSVTSNVITLNAVHGNASSAFNAPISYPAVEFDIRNSTSNDGRYKVLSAAYVGSNTEITIDGTLPSLVGDGVVTNTTSYVLLGTDFSNPFVLFPTQRNDYVNTSLKLSGRNTANWGEDLQQNLLFLLDNFSNVTEPPSKVRGQVWFDKTINKLKVYNGTVWEILTSATAGISYTHNQLTPSNTWNVNHGLNTVDLVHSVYVNTGGPNLTPIIPNTLVIVDPNNITVTFSIAYEGKIVIIAA